MGANVDKVTSNLLDEFSRERDLLKMPESDRFEALAAYCILSREYDGEFSPDALRTGGGNDLAIDAAALLVNGDLVEDEEEITDLRSRNNTSRLAL